MQMSWGRNESACGKSRRNVLENGAEGMEGKRAGDQMERRAGALKVVMRADLLGAAGAPGVGMVWLMSQRPPWLLRTAGVEGSPTS